MSVSTSAILLGIFFVTAIVIGFVKKANTGIIALAFAIIMAMINGITFKVLISKFPSDVVLTLFAVGLFFGYFVENGTLDWIAQTILKRFEKVPKALPFAFFFMAMVLGAIGGGNMVVFSCALAFPIGHMSGIKAPETGAICLLGTQAGSYMPWSQHGSAPRAIIETMNDGAWADQAMRINWGYAAIALISYLIIVIFFYFFFKNYKLTVVAGIKNPEPLTTKQKKSITMIAIVLGLIIIVPNLAKVIDNPLLKTIAGYCDVVPLCLLGSVINLHLGLGDEKEILKKRVPWGVIVMIFGTGILIGVANELGVLEYLSGLATGIPTWIIVPFFIIIAGTLSLFASSLSVAYPTLLPIAGALIIGRGVSPVGVMAAIVIGSATTLMSPLSTGGGQVMSALPEEIMPQQEMFKKMFGMAILAMVILVICSIVGIFNIF